MLHFFKPRQYQIRIDNPCSENWEQMLESENGKFCQHCSKNVIDFTTLTDKQIIDIVSKSSGRSCGRLTNNQLNRTIYDKQEVAYPTLFSKIAASFLLFGLSQSADGYAAKTNSLIAIEFPNAIEKLQTNEKKTITGDSTRVVKGRVLDANTNEAIYGAVVSVENLTIKTVTDSEGFFKFNVPLDTLIVHVKISAVGYNEQEINFPSLSPVEQKILMDANNHVTYRGAVDAVPWVKVEPKKKWWLFRKK